MSIGTSLFLFALVLFLIGFPLLSLVLLLITLGLVVWCGAELLSAISPTPPRLGTSFAVGAGLLVFSTQGLLLMGVSPSIANWCALGSAVVISGRLHWLAPKPEESRFHRLSFELRAAVPIAALALGSLQPWLLWTAVPLLLMMWWYQKLGKSRLTVGLTACALAGGTLMSVQARPDRWWWFYQSNDLQFFESLSWTMSHWGFHVHPGSLTESIAGYHWLSYAFFGGLTHLALLDPWASLARLSGLLISILVASVLVAREDRELTLESFGFATLGTLIVVYPTIDSRLFSIFIAFAFIEFTKKYQMRSTSRRSLFVGLTILISLTLVFSKTTTAVVVALVLLASHAWQLALRRPLEGAIQTVTLCGVGLMSYFFVFREAGITSRASNLIPHLLSPNADMFEDFIRFLSGRSVAIQFGLFAVLLISRRQKVNSPWGISSLLTGLVLAWTSRDFPLAVDALYFSTPAFAMLLLESSSRLSFSENPRWQFQNPAAAVIFAISFFSISGINRLWSTLSSWGWPTQLSNLSGESIGRNGHLLILALTPVILLFLRRHPSRVFLLVCAALIGQIFGVRLQDYQESMARGVDSLSNPRGGNSAPFADLDLQIVGKYIRDNTPDDFVLASNNFCCHGDDWWRRIRNSIKIYDSTTGNDSLGLEPSWGGANYLLPAESRRRFLIQGPNFTDTAACYCGTSLSEEMQSYMTLSLEFANSPDESSLTELRRLGVDGFVVNLSLTDWRDWSGFATEKFTAGNFLFLEF